VFVEPCADRVVGLVEAGTLEDVGREGLVVFDAPLVLVEVDGNDVGVVVVDDEEP